jgi:hypothetical protein
MVKKIKDDKGNVYVQKKPFYKRVWFWILAIIVVFVVGGALGGSKGNSKSNNSTSTSSSNKDKVISKDTELRNKFDAIKVGDLMNSGNGGSTFDEVKSSLGSPNSTSTTDLQGVSVKNDTWSKNGVTILIQFENDKVVSKDITGFKFEKRDEKLTLAEFDQIQNGVSYDEMVSKFGEPDSLSEMVINGETTLTAIWLTGVKGGLGANVTLQFTNGQLMSKMQSELE